MYNISVAYLSALDGSEALASLAGRFALERRTSGTQWRGVCVGPSIGLDAKREISYPPPGIEPRLSGRPIVNTILTELPGPVVHINKTNVVTR
jgi:hypothetical protein